ncbi:glutamate receptor ionotropic, kainate 2-like isoform X2 [Convolutriloba macropyga]|uniref:glutamate receptor ionotropic, kainate 2-like isoform X2 n=1 Tax=Convolutriloba macropyga TaxID=536237 RepID=UPI003F51BD1B
MKFANFQFVHRKHEKTRMHYCELSTVLNFTTSNDQMPSSELLENFIASQNSSQNKVSYSVNFDTKGQRPARSFRAEQNAEVCSRDDSKITKSKARLMCGRNCRWTSGEKYETSRQLSGLVLWVLLVSSCLVQTASATEPRVYPIGAIIPFSQPDVRMMLEWAVEEQNRMNSQPGNFRLRPIIRQIDTDNAFQAAIQACELLEAGVVAIFAPSGKNAGAAIQSFGDMFEVPVIHYSPQFQSDNPGSFYINLYPHYSTINNIMYDIVQWYKWDRFAILYETEDGLRQMNDLMRLQDAGNSSFTAWKVKIGQSEAEIESLKQTLKQFKNTRKRVIVDCHPLTLITLLNQMLSLQMLSEYHHYIFTSFELTEYYLTNYTQGSMNITVFKLMDYDAFNYQGKVNNFRADKAAQLAELPITYIRNCTISLQMALLYDALYVLRNGIASLSNAAVVTPPTNMNCKNPQQGWGNGLSLMNYLRMMSIEGITGSVAFNGMGQREQVKATIIEKRNSEPTVVGNWTNRDGVNITQSSQLVNAKSLMSNKTIRVTTIVTAPFTKKKQSDDAQELKGNDVYEGYCIDLLENMAKYLAKMGVEFNYVIKEVADKKYGSKGDDGEWSGMVGELMRDEADLAVAPLTINYLRQDVIDFSTPFMNLGISILYRMQESKTPSIFSFLKPLHYDIWMYLIVSYIAISMVLFIMARFTPYEWYRPNEDSDEVENQFTLINSLWFAAGAMMQQGSEISPRALSTRIISAMWYLTTVIVIASYTANLAAFLTVTRMKSPIENEEDLARQTKIKYGAVEHGSTYQFFKVKRTLQPRSLCRKDSDIATYSRMWQFMMNEEPSVFVDTSADGIQRVMQDDYAFLMESVMIEYEVSQKCNLTQIGGTLDSKFYGIGLQKNSPYTALISKAILQMQDDGMLVKLKKRWWEDESKCVNRESASGADDASSLKLDSIGGIFYVLIFGTVLGCIIAVIEFIWKSKKNASRDEIPLWRQMLNELGFAFRCRDSSSTVSSPRDQINFKSLPSNENYETSVAMPRIMYNTSYIPVPHGSLQHTPTSPVGTNLNSYSNQNNISTFPRQNNIHAIPTAPLSNTNPNSPQGLSPPDQVDFYQPPPQPMPPMSQPGTYATYRPYAYQNQQQQNATGSVAVVGSVPVTPQTAQPPLKFVETPSILKNPTSNSYVRVDTKV